MHVARRTLHACNLVGCMLHDLRCMRVILSVACCNDVRCMRVILSVACCTPNVPCCACGTLRGCCMAKPCRLNCSSNTSWRAARCHGLVAQARSAAYYATTRLRIGLTDRLHSGAHSERPSRTCAENTIGSVLFGSTSPSGFSDTICNGDVRSQRAHCAHCGHCGH